jgi:hypothetical protein
MCGEKIDINIHFNFILREIRKERKGKEKKRKEKKRKE